MSNYTPLTNFGAKDTLPSGNAAKVVRGSEFTIEFNNIASSIATKAEVNAPSFTSDATFGGNIIVNGTVDGRDVLTDGNKLDTIETSATADQTDAEIRALVESASDSNVFTDADHTKLNTIEESATADQSASEIRTLVESASDSNVFTDADHTKLNTIEASADVTDATNVTAAGAAMLTGASFTGNVSTTGTLATGGFTLPATDGTNGQALLTNGSGAVAWSDVTVDISGKADLSGANFTGDVRISSIFLENAGKIGLGTTTPVAAIDSVSTNGSSIRFSSIEGSVNNIVFHDKTNNKTPASIEVTTNDEYYGYQTTAGILSLKAKSVEAGNNIREENTFKLKPLFTHSNTAIHVSNQEPTDIVQNLASTSVSSFIGQSSRNKAALTTEMSSQQVGNTGPFYDGILASSLITSQSGLIFGASLRVDGEGSIALYNDAEERGVRFNGYSLSPCKEDIMSVTNQQGGTSYIYRPIGDPASDELSLGTVGNRWEYIYLSNSPNVSSDQRLKENIADADDAGSTIDAIQVRKFDWIEDGRHQSYGMIAQELAEVYPEAVNVPENDEDTLGIATGDLIPMLIKEVQSLRNRVAELENV